VIYLLYTIHVLISIFLILVVLLQRGKGADLSVFGGGATQAAFGARGQASLLHKLTVICFVLFIITTLTIGLFQAGRQPSVMGDVPVPATEEAAPPAAELPAPAADPAGEDGGVVPEDGAGAATPAAEAEVLEPAAEPPPAGSGS
jgi:preprotein translocase subunit SecG